MGMPRLALPTLVSYLGSHAFQDHGLGLVWDTTTHKLEEPRADEREHAMGFSTGTSAAPELTESQRRQALGQALDLTSMVWFMDVYLAFQQYNTSGLDEHLGANGSGQGAQKDVVLADMERVAPEESPIWKDSQQAWDRVLGEIKNRDAIEWLVQDELRGQRVLAALALDMGTEAAKGIFRQVFFKKETPYSVRNQEPMSGLAGIADGTIPVVAGEDALVASVEGNGVSSAN